MNRLSLFLAFALLPGLALAQPAPALDMTVPITDWHGQTITDTTQLTPADPQCAKCTPLTIGGAIAMALCRDSTQTTNDPGIIKAKQCALGIRLLDQKDARLTAAEVKTIEDRIGILGPIVSMRVTALIDPNVASEPAKP